MKRAWKENYTKKNYIYKTKDKTFYLHYEVCTYNKDWRAKKTERASLVGLEQ